MIYKYVENIGYGIWKILRQVKCIHILGHKLYVFSLRLKYRNARQILKKTRGQQRFLIMLTPAYWNLGDHAIYLAEKVFLKQYFPQIISIGVTGDMYRLFQNEIEESITKKDIILITGGGFLGSLWPKENNSFLKIIRRFNENPVIVFPQTVYLGGGKAKDALMSNMKETLRGHENLMFCARDKATYDLMKNNHLVEKQNLKLIPDMVTYLNMSNRKHRIVPNKDVLFCLRRDKEKVLTDEMKTFLINNVRQRDLHFADDDTVLIRKLREKNMKRVLAHKWKKFLKFKLIITDRLHGMIFAAILGRPCLALDNCSGKVSGTYQWLSYLDYIKLAESKEDISSALDELFRVEQPCLYHNEKLEPYFNQLVQIIKDRIG